MTFAFEVAWTFSLISDEWYVSYGHDLDWDLQKNSNENIFPSNASSPTDITEKNRQKDQTMSSTKGDNADEHSKIKDMKELRVWEAKDNDTTDFRQSDTAKDLQRKRRLVEHTTQSRSRIGTYGTAHVGKCFFSTLKSRPLGGQNEITADVSTEF